MKQDNSLMELTNDSRGLVS
ncbi:unnamed protein product [Nezara viridula]|uniref:Uncharacterized protein n=1 Tax=Nezara viridula TaxID=85310 RepID=A0A9P0HA96_NEZVI|nr:unnamed protein product [Nezara viridula]